MTQTASIATERAELAEMVLQAHERTLVPGRGKKAAIQERNRLLEDFMRHLQENWGLTDEATIVDALDVARRNLPVSAINHRYASIEGAAVEDEERAQLAALATKYHVRLLPEDIAVELTILTEELYRRAKERQSTWGTAGGGGTSGHLLDLNHARDDMADLRDALVHADIINRIP
jgi:hypothetical protein